MDIFSTEALLVIESKHADGRTKRDLSGKTFRKVLTVKEGDTIDASYDFGVSAF